MPKEPRSFRVEAIILRHSDWGEADRILTLFTQERGKLRAIAKGVRKIRSRKAGHIEPFTRATLQLAKGRNMSIITQAETIDAHMSLRENLLSVGYASYVGELLDRFTYEEGENRSLYNLIAKTLSRLTNPALDPQLVLRYYEIRLLDQVGFRPELFQCVACEEQIQPQDQFFSPARGGVLCPRDGRKEPGTQPISQDALRYLRHFQRSSFSTAANARPTSALHREMEVLMQNYLTYVLERKLNTPSFLRHLRQKKLG